MKRFYGMRSLTKWLPVMLSLLGCGVDNPPNSHLNASKDQEGLHLTISYDQMPPDALLELKKGTPSGWGCQELYRICSYVGEKSQTTVKLDEMNCRSLTNKTGTISAKFNNQYCEITIDPLMGKTDITEVTAAMTVEPGVFVNGSSVDLRIFNKGDLEAGGRNNEKYSACVNIYDVQTGIVEVKCDGIRYEPEVVIPDYFKAPDLALGKAWTVKTRHLVLKDDYLFRISGLNIDKCNRTTGEVWGQLLSTNLSLNDWPLWTTSMGCP